MPQKACPRCQMTAPLDAALCRNCAHQYRTQFTPPVLNSAPSSLAKNNLIPKLVLGASALVLLCGLFASLHTAQNSLAESISAKSANAATGGVIDVNGTVHSGISENAAAAVRRGMTEYSLFGEIGCPVGQPALTDTGGDLLVYPTLEGGMLAIRCEYAGGVDNFPTATESERKIKHLMGYEVHTAILFDKGGKHLWDVGE